MAAGKNLSCPGLISRRSRSWRVCLNWDPASEKLRLGQGGEGRFCFSFNCSPWCTLQPPRMESPITTAPHLPQASGSALANDEGDT